MKKHKHPVDYLIERSYDNIQAAQAIEDFMSNNWQTMVEEPSHPLDIIADHYFNKYNHDKYTKYVRTLWIVTEGVRDKEGWPQVLDWGIYKIKRGALEAEVNGLELVLDFEWRQSNWRKDYHGSLSYMALWLRKEVEYIGEIK